MNYIRATRSDCLAEHLMGSEDGGPKADGGIKLDSEAARRPPLPESNSQNAVFSHWHGITLVALFVGYAGYYVCRSNLSIVNPADLGLDEIGLGRIFSIGVLMYAIGKVINGIAADFVGGRVLFLFGMLASVAATVIFALGTGWWHFAIVWGVNRFVQSMGWGGLVQVSGRWFRERTLATVMGILAVSYFIGDATARLYLGWRSGRGLDWQACSSRQPERSAHRRRLFARLEGQPARGRPARTGTAQSQFIRR